MAAPCVILVILVNLLVFWASLGHIFDWISHSGLGLCSVVWPIVWVQKKFVFCRDNYIDIEDNCNLAGESNVGLMVRLDERCNWATVIDIFVIERLVSWFCFDCFRYISIIDWEQRIFQRSWLTLQITHSDLTNYSLISSFWNPFD